MSKKNYVAPTGKFYPLGTNHLFEKACSLAGVQPTKRQYTKFRKGYGLGFLFKKEAQSSN